jgi:hypothetical protein
MDELLPMLCSHHQVNDLTHGVHESLENSTDKVDKCVNFLSDVSSGYG